MPQVLIQIGQSTDNQYSYFLSQEKIKDLLKFVEAIVDETDLLLEEEIEDIGMRNAIKNGRTGEFINTTNFVKELRK